MKPAWMVAHNCLVHPLMGLFDLATWGHYTPPWLEMLHEWTARKAGFME